MSSKAALLIGATGLVGRQVLTLLLNSVSYDKIVVLSRRPLSIQHPKLSVHVVDFDRLDEFSDLIMADDIYCTLGTTIRHAGSKEAFRRVDLEYPLKIANIALTNGAQKYLVVTAIGANPESKFFYFRVKGELEGALALLPYKALHFFRPAWLVGKREESRFREKLGIVTSRVLSFVFVGKWRKYRATDASVVAKAMILAAESPATGLQIYKSDRINNVTKGTPIL